MSVLVNSYFRGAGLFDAVSNTAAYKQIGNGVSIPVGVWAAKELKRYFDYCRGITQQMSFVGF